MLDLIDETKIKIDKKRANGIPMRRNPSLPNE